jgi:hypothetical protein
LFVDDKIEKNIFAKVEKEEKKARVHQCDVISSICVLSYIL